MMSLKNKDQKNEKSKRRQITIKFNMRENTILSKYRKIKIGIIFIYTMIFSQNHGF